MLGLKWAIPQSLGQSRRREAENISTNLFIRFFLLICLEVCFFKALTQVKDFMLWLSSGGKCVCSCRQRCLAQQQRQQQRQQQKQRRSWYSHRLPENHRPAHIPRFLYQAHADVRKQVHTQEQHPSGDNGCVTTKAECWIVLL